MFEIKTASVQKQAKLNDEKQKIQNNLVTCIYEENCTPSTLVL